MADVHRGDQVADVRRVEGAPEDPEALARHPRNLFAPNVGPGGTSAPGDIGHPRPGISGSGGWLDGFALWRWWKFASTGKMRGATNR